MEVYPGTSSKNHVKKLHFWYALLLYKNILVVTLTIFWSSQHLCDLVTTMRYTHATEIHVERT